MRLFIFLASRWHVFIWCIFQIGLAGFVTAVQQKNASVAIIDCSVVVRTAGLLAAAWNYPIMGFGTSAQDISDKSIYPTFSRVFPSGVQVNKIILLYQFCYHLIIDSFSFILKGKNNLLYHNY